ncbi:MAG: TetR/AcrR family transcriptional regulator [Gemmobacter sp.]|nr:TetR/AcrR family transcriptional regulator [Gemmobacter sp.]
MVLPPSETGEKRAALGRADWIEAARNALVSGGITDVKVDRLAVDLGISRGSFYWHFASRADLLAAVLHLWEQRNTRPFLEVVENNQTDPRHQMLAYFDIWRADGSFDPKLDAAVRDWARTAPDVAAAVLDADARRLSVLEVLFLRAGYEPTEALIRARATYYHQIGYFALGIQQTMEERSALLPMYFRVLTGFPIPVKPRGDP